MKTSMGSVLALSVARLLAGCGGNEDREPHISYKYQTSLESKSPNGQVTVLLVEADSGIDRNFEIRVHGPNMATGRHLVIFISPDEGRGPKECLHWSPDSRYFLLTGGSFAVKPEDMIAPGCELYLLFDAVKHRLWCNALQTDYDRFNLTDLATRGFDTNRICHPPMATSSLEMAR